MKTPIVKETLRERRNITTMKLDIATKERLDHLRVYKRETYDDLLQRLLQVLNLCRVSPERAQARLLMMEKQKKIDKQKNEIEQTKNGRNY